MLQMRCSLCVVFKMHIHSLFVFLLLNQVTYFKKVVSLISILLFKVWQEFVHVKSTISTAFQFLNLRLVKFWGFLVIKFYDVFILFLGYFTNVNIYCLNLYYVFNKIFTFSFFLLNCQYLLNEYLLNICYAPGGIRGKSGLDRGVVVERPGIFQDLVDQHKIFNGRKRPNLRRI